MDERKMILEMLKDGNITSEEALRLLDALNQSTETKKTASKHEKFFTFDMDKAKEGLEEVEKSVGGFISNLVNTVFDDDFVFSIKGKYDSFTKVEERQVHEGETKELQIYNKNGRIELLPTDDDKIIIESKIFHKSLQVNELTRFYNIIEEEGKFVYRANDSADTDKKYYIEVKLFVPKEALHSLTLETSNAPLSVEGLACAEVTLVTRNGKVNVKQMLSDTIRMETSNQRLELAQSQVKKADLKTSNGKVTLEEIVADEVFVNTSNGRIDTRDVDCVNLVLNTSNSTLLADEIATERLEEGHFTCSNGKIALTFKEIHKEVDLDLHTSMGTIDLQLPLPLLYESNPSQYAKSVKAHTEGYTEENGLSIFARTTNGSISLR